MMDEEPEDDVLFDQSGLLSKTIKPMKRIKAGAPAPAGQQRLFKTLCLCAAFFALGLCLAVPGPTLKDLQHKVRTDDKHIGIIYTGRSVGYLAGSFIGGLLFDKLNQYLLMSVALFFTGIATIIAPFSIHLYLLIGLISIQGITMGFLDTGGNVVCVNLWGQQSGPYMQAMHFSFGAGAFLAPLLAEPFLINPNSSTEPPSVQITNTPTTVTVTEQQVTNTTTERTTNAPETNNGTTVKSRKKRDTSSIPNLKKYIPVPEKFQFAFVTIGVLVIVISFLFTYLCCCGKRGSHAARNSEITGQVISKEPSGFRLQVLIMLFIFYFFYVGMEVSYGGLCANFAIDKFEWTKGEAAYLTAVFWGSFALSRFVAIFISLAKFSPSIILIADLVITFFSLLVLVMLNNTSNHEYAVWICSSTLGVGLASIFPTGLVWAENYMEITGRAASVFVVGSALGEMVLPLTTSFAMGYFKNPMYLMYILLGCSFIAGSIFIFLLRVASSQGGRYQKVGMARAIPRNKARNRGDTSLEMEGVNNARGVSNDGSSDTAVISGPSRRQKPSFKGGAKAD